jgi:hypothetical protein
MIISFKERQLLCHINHLVATFQLETQCLNQQHHHVPPGVIYINYSEFKYQNQHLP